MANSLTNLIPQLLAQGLVALRENAVMPQLVNRAYDALAGEKGSTIDIPIPSAITAVAVTAAATPPATADISPTTAAVTFNQWYEAPFQLSDKERMTVMNGSIPLIASEAIKALANNVDSYILGLYTSIYGYQGTAGTTPFASDVGDATGVRKTLFNQLSPPNDRRMVIGPDAEANALNLRAFHDMSFSGDARGIIEGQVNRKFGMDWFMDQNIPTHTTAAAGTVLIDQADVAVGDTDVHFDGVTTAVGVGDVFTVAGDTQTYTVLTVGALSTNDQDITKFAPAAVVAWPDNNAVTFKASHVVNLGFHRDAFAFASRPLADQDDGTQSASAVDPVSGLALRLELTREHKRTRWSFDILYGATLVRPELAVRLAG